MFLQKDFKGNSLRKGFTLIELMVSIGVMAIIMGVSLSGGPQAITRLALADNTYQTELLLREVQLQGSSINSLNNVFGGAGLIFDRASSSQVLKFKDRAIYDPSRAISVGDGLYNASPIDEKDTIMMMTNRNVVGKICVTTTSPSVFVCNTAATPAIQTLTISFSRPRQTAHIYVNNSTTTDYVAACIQFDSFRSPEQGYVKSLYVYKSGMITKKMGICR